MKGNFLEIFVSIARTEVPRAHIDTKENRARYAGVLFVSERRRQFSWLPKLGEIKGQVRMGYNEVSSVQATAYCHRPYILTCTRGSCRPPVTRQAGYLACCTLCIGE
jgi:hypothetical protein